jgi:hypothetical protein
MTLSFKRFLIRIPLAIISLPVLVGCNDKKSSVEEFAVMNVENLMVIL